MAPRRKPKPANVPGPGREFKLRIPEDIAQQIEAKAKDKRRPMPMNRVVINMLGDYPDLEKYRDFGNLLEEMKLVLAHYGSRVVLADLGEPLLRAVDDVLTARNGGELQSRLDKLRFLRADMLKHERASKQ